MRHHLHFTLSICLLVASLGCSANSGSAQQQPAQTASPQTNGSPAAAATNAPAAGGSLNKTGTTTTTTTPAAPVARAFDACALISADDIKAVQGEAVSEAKPGSRSGTEFAITSCFYTTPTFTKSVSLEVTQKGATSGSVREFWKKSFATALDKRDRKNERRKKQGKPQAGEPARAIEGIGDEAYWISTNANSTLYAFKNDTLVRISIGGADTEEARLKKIRTLAEKALARL